jgi:adiponectin receptor
METMNIWMYLLEFAAFVTVGFYLYSHTRTLSMLKLSSGGLFAFEILIASAVLCFELSATFHTLRSHLYNVHHF